MINALIATLTLGQCLLTVHILALRSKHANVNMPLAGFFLVLAIFHFYHLAKESISASNLVQFMPEVMLAKQLVELTMAPLFWLYIRELTSAHSTRLRKTDIAHLLVPLAVSVVLVLSVNISPYQAASEPPFIVRLNEALNITILIQLFSYAVIVLPRLSRYQHKLKGLFSNAANLMEQKWLRLLVVLIVATLLLEVTAQFLNFTREIPDSFHLLNSVLRALIVWFLAAWGLRQRPELRIELEKTSNKVLPADKYQKSAMDQEKLVEVASEIRAALEERQLYRDPNLSLRRLADEIQVLPNYVSQALNMEINETFFDYVNQLRIQAAMHQLKTSDETVLKISTDVGFNSRSSFYTAFKKITGKTPVVYRKMPGA